MKITNVYVAYESNGNYLYIYAHKNGIIEVNPVADIYDASTRTRPGARDGNEAKALARFHIIWVPIEVQTTYTPRGDL